MMPDRHPHNFAWTDEAIQILRERFAAGDSYAQIGRKLRCSRNAALGKAHRLGLGRGEASTPKARAVAAVRAAHSSLATVVRNAAARKPDQPLPPTRPDKLNPTATIDTLTGHSCRWPIGDPRAAGFGFCGRHKDDLDRPYCEAHAKVARGQPATKAQREAAAKARLAKAKAMRRAA